MGKSPKCKYCKKIIEDISLAIKHTEKSQYYFCSQECHDLEYPPKSPKVKIEKPKPPKEIKPPKIKLVKCRKCKKEINKLDAVINPDKPTIYYCSQECCDYVKPPPPAKPIDEHFTKLMEYIDNLYDNNVNFPLLNSQLKKAKEEYGYTTKGILLTLKYHQEILSLNFEEKYGIISILNYYYKEAKEFHIKKIEISKKIKEFNFNDDVIIVKKSEKELEFDDI